MTNPESENWRELLEVANKLARESYAEWKTPESQNRAAGMLAIKWADAVLAQRDRIQTADPAPCDVDLFVVALDLCERSSRAFATLVKTARGAGCLQLLGDLLKVAPDLRLARNAIEHAVEWTQGKGRRQPNSPFARGAPVLYLGGVVTVHCVGEDTGVTGQMAMQVAPDRSDLYVRDATIPVAEVCDIVARLGFQLRLASIGL